MGAEASTAGPEEEGAEGDGAAANEKENENYTKVLNGQVDAHAAFGEAYRDDVESLEEIRRIAEAIASGKGDKAEVTAESERLERMAREQERRDARAKSATAKKAKEQADDWLESQLREGQAAEAEARAAKERAAKARAADQAAQRAAAAAKDAERLQARREQLARAALLENADAAVAAAAAAEAATLAASTASAAERFEKVRSLPAPIRISAAVEAPGGSDGGCPPAPPPPAPPPAAAREAEAARQEEVPEFYKLLGVGVDATFDEIKKGYRKMALHWHPDKNRHRLEEATARFQCISEAFDTLYDPAKKTDYDAGKLFLPGKAKKLQGHGWSGKSDESDETLTPQGLKWKKQSWRSYIFLYGRIDDDPDQLVQDDNDPRAPQEKIKIFWRYLGEMATLDREEASNGNWMQRFVEKIWKDTPSKWPSAVDLKSMNDAAQQEWKERRMVFNRRRQKLKIAVELHEDYLNIPDREEKELERLGKRREGWMRRMGGQMSEDPFRVG